MMKDKNYLVVGGSHGIGLGIVKRLVDQGANVTVLSRTDEYLGSSDPLQDAVKHIRFDVMTDDVPTDSIPDSLHGLAYCPGSINLGPVRGIKSDQLLSDFDLNVAGAVRCIQASLKSLKASGAASIILFSTVAVQQGLPMHASVSSVKGAVEGLARSLAAELAPGIRVNCIAPSLTDTPLAERLLSSEEKRTTMGKRHPLGRIGTVDDLASIAEFLLSDQSGWITGQVLGVDGGMSSLRV